MSPCPTTATFSPTTGRASMTRDSAVSIEGRKAASRVNLGPDQTPDPVSYENAQRIISFVRSLSTHLRYFPRKLLWATRRSCPKTTRRC